MIRFSFLDAQMEFVSIFQEGKELADQSEILEQPQGGNLNPETLYYGQGADEWLRLGACDPTIAAEFQKFLRTVNQL